MRFTELNSVDGVTEQFFELTVNDELVPGVIWMPDSALGPRPLVLMAHGGGQHKTFAPFAGYARRFARDLQFVVVAIDAPGHGARGSEEITARLSEIFRKPRVPREGLDGPALDFMMRSAKQAVPEWKVVLEEVQTLESVGSGGPVGFLGLSMGAMTGVLLAASEPRISAAVLGLVGLRAETPEIGAAAKNITVPLEFLMQWDDELVPRNAALSLFDAIGSSQKTLHANPGGHAGVPIFERIGWMQMFTRHFSADMSQRRSV